MNLILCILDIIVSAFISVLLFIQITQNKDDIEKLYDLYYELNELQFTKKEKEKKKGRVVNFDSRNF